MLALRGVAGTSPAVAKQFPSVLQSLAGVRKSVGVDGPQQLLDYTAPPVDLRAMAANNPPAASGPIPTAAPAVGCRRTGTRGQRSQQHRNRERAGRRARTPAEACRNAAAGRLPPEWMLGKPGDRHLETFNADNLYEKIDGRAESFIQYGVKGMAYAFYHPTGDPSNELQLYVFEMGDSLKSLGKYGSEKPEEFQDVR